MVHESFEVTKCQPIFIVIGVQQNIPMLSAAQVFQIRVRVTKILGPKDIS